MPNPMLRIASTRSRYLATAASHRCECPVGPMTNPKYFAEVSKRKGPHRGACSLHSARSDAPQDGHRGTTTHLRVFRRRREPIATEARAVCRARRRRAPGAPHW